MPNPTFLILLDTISILSDDYTGTPDPISLDWLSTLYVYQPASQGKPEHISTSTTGCPTSKFLDPVMRPHEISLTARRRARFQILLARNTTKTFIIFLPPNSLHNLDFQRGLGCLRQHNQYGRIHPSR